MSRSPMLWVALGALATACSTLATHPADLDEDDPQKPEQSADKDTTIPAGPTSSNGAQQGPARAPQPSNSSPDAGSRFSPEGPITPAADAGSAPTAALVDDTRACIVTGSGGYTSAEVLRWRETWDATTRVHTRYVTAAPDSQIELAWRYDAQGRALAYIGVRNAFQHDYLFDEHGNMKDFRLSYPPRPDLFVPSPVDPWMGFSYANEYTDSGVLLASTGTPYGAGNSSAQVVHKTFVQDEQGRCVRVESKGGYADTIETRDYVAGRLSTVHVEYSRSAAFNFDCRGATTTYEYDGAGRVVRETKRCDGGAQAQAISIRTHVYAADGSVTIDSLNFDTDVGHEVTIDGKTSFASQSTEKRSPGCAAVDQEIPSANTACRPL